MGFQLPGPTKGKVEHLIAKYGAERLAKPPKAFHGIPEGKALVCVVDSVTYETAHYCFSAAEMAQLNDATDFRSRTWLLMYRDRVERLSRLRTTS
jgi:hypothetical protein